MASDLARLATRVEAADGPDRELDALVAATRIRNIEGTIFRTIEAWATEAVKQSWMFNPYTRSLDAAMSLVPESTVFSLRTRFDGTTFAEIHHRGGASIMASNAGEADSPARALTAASLRAIDALRSQDKGEG